ncbi:hypothetical protein [Streptomyces sp. NPDC017993]|uniref:hypothetical protein n=1 Tax=Streptomyces sp. NPDC017993 TaxID=3365027 RepID=UPI00379D1C3F
MTGEFAAHPAKCRQAFQVTIDFGFVPVDAIAGFLPEEEAIDLVQPMGFCDCGRLALDDDLTRSALSGVATENMTACQGLVLAAIDYAHRTFGCAGLSALVHELAEGDRATFEPPPLTALMDRIRMSTRQKTATPDTAESPTP